MRTRTPRGSRLRLRRDRVDGCLVTDVGVLRELVQGREGSSGVAPSRSVLRRMGGWFVFWTATDSSPLIQERPEAIEPEPRPAYEMGNVVVNVC